MKFFEADGFFFRLIGTLTNILEVNLLWILCSLPIFTIGASTTAAYYVSMKMVKGEEGKIAQQFFHSFKRDFKQSTIVWIIFFVYGLVLTSDIYYLIKVNENSSKLLIISTVFMTIIYLVLILHIFPMIARYDNSLKNIFKNSLIVSIRYFGNTMLMLFTLAILIILAISNWNMLGLVIIFGMGAFSFISSSFIVKTFDKLEESVKTDNK